MAFMNENIQDTINTMAAMKEANIVQKEQMKNFNMDEMEDVLEDMADMMADQEEIQEMMCRDFGVEYDENELMNELAELDAEILDEECSVPSYIPQGNKNPAIPSKPMPAEVKQPLTEEQELENMMKP